MGAVVEFVEDVVGGIVEAVGDVVETVADVVSDVGAAIDDYVIQPILEDPVTAIATVAAASFLGPAAAAYFGTSASVGVGIAAGLGNTAAGLAQGESFDEAIKGGLAAGVGSGLGAEFFGPTPGDVPAPTDSLDNWFSNYQAGVDAGGGPNLELGGPNVEIGAPIPEPQITATEIPALGAEVPPPVPPSTPSPLQSIADAAGPVVPEPVAPSPLQSLNTPAPEVNIPAPPAPSPLSLPEFSANYDSSFTPDYNLASGTSASGPGLKLPDFTPDTPTTNYLTGQTNYDLIPPGTTGGPGLQPSSAPNLASMGGGQGLTVDMAGLPQYMENGVPTSFTGANGQIYGNPTPDITIGQNGITPTPNAINYGATTNMGTPTTPSVLDQLKAGDLSGAAKTAVTGAGSSAVDWITANPWTAAGTALAATSVLGGGAKGPTSATPPPKGSTQDKNFGKSLDLYNYMRDQNNYGGDLSKYGQVGQPNAAEHQFFQNTKFVPVPIPGQPPTGVKMGGLIQMKHFAQGGQAQGMQDPRRAQMMAAMAQQRPAGQGGPMGMAQGRPPMMQGAPQGMPPQGMPPQGMQQGRPQMPQRPRDPKTAYYQYGNPPTQAKAMGGLSQVQSMRIGGGADGRSDDVNAVLSDGEYVMDAESVAMLGNGSSKAGAAKLDQMRSKLRQHKGRALAGGKISPNAKSPLSYLKGA